MKTPPILSVLALFISLVFGSLRVAAADITIQDIPLDIRTDALAMSYYNLGQTEALASIVEWDRTGQYAVSFRTAAKNNKTTAEVMKYTPGGRLAWAYLLGRAHRFEQTANVRGEPADSNESNTHRD